MVRPMNNLGVLLSNQGKFDEAQVFLREALEADERKLGADHPEVGAELINLAKAICRGSSHYEDGERFAARAANVFAKAAGPESWPVGQARVMRGTCLTRLRRFGEAESEVRSGIGVLSKEFGATHWGRFRSSPSRRAG